MTARLKLSWAVRTQVLAPNAVAASGNTRRDLLRSTLQRLAAGADLRVAKDGGWVLVLGADTDLPWADGAHYLAFDSGVLIPTTHVPSVPPALLRAALPVAELVAVLPGVVLLSDRPARPADPTLLLEGD